MSTVNATQGEGANPSAPPATLDDMIAQARAGAEAEAQGQVTEETSDDGQEQESSTEVEANESATLQETELERSDSAEDENKPVYTRKDAARLAQQLEETKAKQAELESQIKAREEEDKRLADEVSETLGTAKAYEAAKATLLDNTKPKVERDNAAELIRTYDANRGFFNKLERAAFLKITNVVSGDFAKAATELSGVDQKILFGTSMFEALKHVYEAGQATKDAEIKRIRTELEGLQKKAAGSKQRAPVSGGGFSGVPTAFDEMFDPKTGAVKEEYAAMAKSGALRG